MTEPLSPSSPVSKDDGSFAVWVGKRVAVSLSLAAAITGMLFLGLNAHDIHHCPAAYGSTIAGTIASGLLGLYLIYRWNPPVQRLFTRKVNDAIKLVSHETRYVPVRTPEEAALAFIKSSKEEQETTMEALTPEGALRFRKAIISNHIRHLESQDDDKDGLNELQLIVEAAYAVRFLEALQGA